jgi:hypothetical protein
MQSQDDKSQVFQKPNEASVFALFVPLYLVILAFFVLLNTISEENPVKKDGAISSIGESFAAGKGRADVENRALFMDFAQIVTTYFDDIEKELKSAYKTDEIIVERKGYKIKINIPLRKVFLKDSADIIEFEKRLFNRLVKTISLERQGVSVKVNIKVDSESLSSLLNDDPFKIDKERTSNVVKEFIKNGVPSKNLSAGIAFNNESNLLIETTVEKKRDLF